MSVAYNISTSVVLCEMLLVWVDLVERYCDDVS